MNQKLINDLREGRIVLHNEPKNPEAVKEITGVGNFTGNGIYYYWDKSDLCFYCAGKVYDAPGGLPLVPVADFLRPEPRFKAGQGVSRPWGAAPLQGEIIGYHYNEEEKEYFYNIDNTGVGHAERVLTLVYEPATPQQFEIGKQYDFQQEPNTDWKQGKFLGVFDCKGKRFFLSEEDGFGWPVINLDIRPLQPRTVSRWISVCPDGRVLRKSYETEQEARYKACQGGMTDCKQVKLEGFIL